MKIRSKSPKQGSILVTLLFLVSILALLVAAVASDSMQTLKTVSQSGRDTQAKYAAYAGMEMVMNELRKEERYLGDGKPLADNHGRKTGELGQLSKVNYDVLIWNNMPRGDASDTPEAIDGPDGMSVQPDTVYMVSTGTDTVRGEEVVLASMGGTARRIRSVFEDAAFARSKMLIQGSALIDAWDSGGGWTPYVAGDFPGDPASPPPGPTDPPRPNPTTKDHAATLGTDSAVDRTVRLLESSKVNGFFRVGPGATAATAFSKDSGTTTTSTRATTVTGGDSESSSTSSTSFGIATAKDPTEQVAGIENKDEGYFKVDDKATEMPSFTSPWEAEDLLPAPVVNNPATERDVPNMGGPGTHKEPGPPNPVELQPGGYKSVDVPDGQTLSLSPGVYYFADEMKVKGKIELSGSDAVIVFVGKKAIFDHAHINPDGKTSAFQLCFTDEIKKKEDLDPLLASLQGLFEQPESSDLSAEEYVRSLIAPQANKDDPSTAEGASVLEMTGGELFGSVSGKNLVVRGSGGSVYGAMMANVMSLKGTNIHQDLALKGSNLMNAGGWSLEGIHQLR